MHRPACLSPRPSPYLIQVCLAEGDRVKHKFRFESPEALTTCEAALRGAIKGSMKRTKTGSLLLGTMFDAPARPSLQQTYSAEL